LADVHPKALIPSQPPLAITEFWISFVSKLQELLQDLQCGRKAKLATGANM
jgi:hypothetical protein